VFVSCKVGRSYEGMRLDSPVGTGEVWVSSKAEQTRVEQTIVRRACFQGNRLLLTFLHIL